MAEVSNAEIEEDKCGYQAEEEEDMYKSNEEDVGGDGNRRRDDDPIDGSYVFVSVSGGGDPVDKVLTFNGEIVQSSAVENNCIVPSKDDDVNSLELEGSLGSKLNGETESVDFAVEDPNKRNAVVETEPEPLQLDFEVTGADPTSTSNPKDNQDSQVESAAEFGGVETQESIFKINNLNSTAAELGRSQESQNVDLEASGCKSSEAEVGEVKSEEQTKLKLARQVGKGTESKNVDLEASVCKSSETEAEADVEVGEVKSEEQPKLKLARPVGESSESKNVDLEASGCKSSGAEVGEVKSEEQTKSEFARQVGENLESQVIITKLVESGSCQLDNGEEENMLEKRSKRDLDKDESAREVEEGPESQIILTKSVESGSYQLEHGEEKNKTYLDTDVEENQESQTLVTDIVQSGLNQGQEAAKLAYETDGPLETETASDPVPYENEVSLIEELSESIDSSLKAPGFNENPENAESLPSPSPCVRSESGIYVPVENGGSFSAAPGDGTMLELGVGDGACLITDFPTSAAADTKRDTEVENLDVINRESVLSCPTDNSKSEIEVNSGPVEGDSMVTCPTKYVCPETEIGFGTIDPKQKSQKFQCDNVHMNSEILNGDIECACSQCISANDLDPEYHTCDSLENGSCADAKSASEVEKSSAVSNKDMPCNDDSVSESEVLNGYVVTSESSANFVLEIIDAENLGDQFNGGDVSNDNKLRYQETEDIVRIHRDGQNVGAECLTRPFHFLIRIPRFDDEKLREQIKHAQVQVDEKTQRREAIRVEIQIKRANCQAHGDRFEAAKSEERAARRLVKLKRQDIDSVQSVINRVKNAISVEDIDGRIYNKEHKIEHETLPLKEEKQFIREIKQLKHLREQLSTNMGSQDEVQQALDQRDQIEERLKILKKELDCLKERVSKAEAASVAAGKKYDDESKRLKELQAQFRAADDIRQESYAHLQTLKKELFGKNKNFRIYKDDAAAASAYALRGDREALYALCVNQVETVMELWNKNDEFRKEYVRCNIRSTVRRLRTLDGRSLGPDEEPPVLPTYVHERLDRLVSSPGEANPVSLVSTLEQSSPVEGEADDKSIENVQEQKNQTVKTAKTSKPILEGGSAMVSSRDETEETKEEENMQTKEEQVLAMKVEELRKEEVEAKLKEQRRLEEKTKAKEALQRKKRTSEKAQIRAELRAQKEAEEKEREREKRLRKKERKKATTPEVHGGETAPTSEVLTETTMESEIKESPTTITKRSPRPSHLTKQRKPKSIPPPLRNKGKRRMQQWMWMILAALLFLVLFLLGNSGFFFNLQLRRVGF